MIKRTVGVWVFLCLSASAAFGQAVPAIESQPPRPTTDIVDSVIRCHAIHGQNGTLTGTVDIAVSVGMDGRARSVTTAPGLPEHLAAASQCVGVMLRYQPAREAGVPVVAKLDLPVTFPSLPTLKGDLRKAIDFCHAPRSLQDLKEGSVHVIVRVGTDGKVKEFKLPEGVLPWMADAAQCVTEQVDFYPALLRTKLVESWVILPLEFNLTRFRQYDAEIVPPTPRSGESEILAAYRSCYPAGKTASVRIEYRIIVAKTGRVIQAEALESSGDAELDAAGICILEKLVFVAARRNGRAVEATLNWPILVRPPD